jgi:hypothetical protein
MFVLVAVEAQQLPVAAVRRIVVVIVIPVMHREPVKVFPAAEITPAARAEPGMDLKGVRPHVLAAFALSV